MKALLIAMIFFAGEALAADQPQPIAPVAPAVQPLPAARPGTVIVNGKRFFPLNGARRFSGDANNPAALNVMHHPRPATIVAHHAPLGGHSYSSTPPKFSEPSTPTAKPSDVLSVFAPSEVTKTSIASEPIKPVAPQPNQAIP